MLKSKVVYVAFWAGVKSRYSQPPAGRARLGSENCTYTGWVKGRYLCIGHVVEDESGALLEGLIRGNKIEFERGLCRAIGGRFGSNMELVDQRSIRPGVGKGER